MCTIKYYCVAKISGYKMLISIIVPIFVSDSSQFDVPLSEAPSGRMRKRDIVRYYGKRMIRKAGMELRHLRRRPREKVVNIAKRCPSCQTSLPNTAWSILITLHYVDFSKDLISQSVSYTRNPRQHSLRLIHLRSGGNST